MHLRHPKRNINRQFHVKAFSKGGFPSLIVNKFEYEKNVYYGQSRLIPFMTCSALWHPKSCMQTFCGPTPSILKSFHAMLSREKNAAEEAKYCTRPMRRENNYWQTEDDGLYEEPGCPIHPARFQTVKNKKGKFKHRVLNLRSD